MIWAKELKSEIRKTDIMSMSAFFIYPVSATFSKIILMDGERPLM